jgi:hypothetical protein
LLRLRGAGQAQGAGGAHVWRAVPPRLRLLPATSRRLPPGGPRQRGLRRSAYALSPMPHLPPHRPPRGRWPGCRSVSALPRGVPLRSGGPAGAERRLSPGNGHQLDTRSSALGAARASSEPVEVLSRAAPWCGPRRCQQPGPVQRAEVVGDSADCRLVVAELHRRKSVAGGGSRQDLNLRGVERRSHHALPVDSRVHLQSKPLASAVWPMPGSYEPGSKTNPAGSR